MKRLAHEDVVLCVGKRKSGKSYKAKELLEAELRAGARVVALDVHDEYSRQGRPTKATNLGPLRDRCTVAELEDAPEQLDAEQLSLAVCPEYEDEEDLAEQVKSLLRMVRRTGDVTLCLDEVGEYVRRAEGQLNSAATQSRHWGDAGCPIIFVAQRMTQVPLSARAQCSILWSGKQTDPTDLRSLQEITGDPAFAAEVSRLPRPGLLEWRDTNN